MVDWQNDRGDNSIEDESGAVAAHVDAGEAADLLDIQSVGRLRRVLALTVTLPPAGPFEMGLKVSEDEQRLAVL